MEGTAGLDQAGALRRQRRRDALLDQQRASMTGTSGFHLSPEAVRRQRGQAARREQERITMTGDTGLANSVSVWNNSDQSRSEASRFSPGKALAGGVQKGINGAATAVGDVLAFAEDLAFAPFELFSGQKLGTASDYGVFNELADKLHEEGAAIKAKYAENAEAGEFAGKVLYDGTALAVELLPMAVAALVTGGGSAALQTTAGLEQMSSAALSPGLRTTLADIGKRLVQDPQFWQDFARTVGGNYRQSVAELEERAVADEISGRAPAMDANEIRLRAMLYAIGESGIDAAISSGGGIQTFPGELRSGKNTWRGIVESGLREGAERTAAGIIGRGFDELPEDDPDLASLHNRNAMLSIPAMADDFAAGTLAGSALSGAQAAFHYAEDAVQRLAAAGEARLLAGEMPSQDQLRAMGMSESEALGMLAFYAAEDNAEDGKIAVQTALELEKSVKPKPYLFNRPSYKKGQVEQVWENALKNSPQPGKVIDPSGEEIFWDRSKPRKGQWDMGHIPGQKYSEKHKEYIEGRMTKAEFLAWYHDPANYRPELPKTNRSHKYE